MKIEVNIEKRHLVVFLVAIGLVAGFGVVVAYGDFLSGSPAVIGHSSDEVMVKVPDSASGTEKTLQTAIDEGFGGGQWVDVTGGINYDGGNVGVGASNPAAKLDVRAPSGRQIALFNWADLSSSGIGVGLFGGNVYIDDVGGAFHYSKSHGTIGAAGFAVNYPSQSKASIFANAGPSTAGATLTPNIVATFQSDGNVGIGTPAPSEKLTIAKGGAGKYISMQDGAGTEIASFERVGNDIQLNSFGNLLLTNNRIGIGVTSPTADLHAAGVIRSGSIDSGVGYFDTLVPNNLGVTHEFGLPKWPSPQSSCTPSFAGSMYLDTAMPGGNKLPCVCILWNGVYKWAPTDNWDAVCD